MNDSDVLLKLREEEWSLLRHYEGQRVTVTNMILAIMSVAVGFLSQKGINRDSLPITILLIILGVYGIFAVAKFYERFILLMIWQYGTHRVLINSILKLA